MGWSAQMAQASPPCCERWRGCAITRAGKFATTEDHCNTLPAQQLSQRLAYLAQRGPVAWPLTVERLVALGRLPHLISWGMRDARGAVAIATALTDTDTLHLRQRVVDTLSGGELARALARASAGSRRRGVTGR